MRVEKLADNFTLICADAIEFMQGMNEDVDLIVVDPPYKLTSGGSETGEMGGSFSPSEYNNNGSIVECDIDWPDFMPLLFRALRPRTHAYVMANNRNVQAMLNAARWPTGQMPSGFEALLIAIKAALNPEDRRPILLRLQQALEEKTDGFYFHNLLVWDKIAGTPNRWYMKELEFVGFFSKGEAKYINDCSSKQRLECAQKDESNHPTEKPVAVMQHYIENSSKQGEIVFDPFMGSGTTGVAAAKAGRGFIGIEKNEEFFEIAVKRIGRAVERGPDMVFPEFVKPRQVVLMDLPRMKKPK